MRYLLIVLTALIPLSASYSNDASERAMSIIEGKVKDKIEKTILDSVSNNYSKMSKYFDGLSRSAFSTFGKANKLPDEKRKKIQSKMSALSKKYGHIGNDYKVKANRFNLLKKIPVVGIASTLWYEKQIADDIKQIESELGVNVNRAASEIVLDKVTSIINGLTYDVFKAGRISYDHHSGAPVHDNSKSMIGWASDMESSATEYVYKKDDANNPYPPPVGILQYMKMKYKMEKKIMKNQGVTDYVNPKLEWVEEWNVSSKRDAFGNLVIDYQPEDNEEQRNKTREDELSKKIKHKKDKSKLATKRGNIQRSIDSNKNKKKSADRTVKSASATLSFLHKNRRSKQQKLDTILSKRRVPRSTKKEERELTALQTRVDYFKRVYDIKRRTSGRALTYSEKLELHALANKLGFKSDSSLLRNAGRYYTNEKIKARNLVKVINKIKNSGGVMSASDQRQVSRLKSSLASIDNQIESEGKRLNSAKDNLYTYNSESSNLIKEIISIDQDIVQVDDTYYSSIGTTQVTPDTETPAVQLVWSGAIGIVGSGSGTYRYSSSGTPSYNGESQTPLVKGGASLSVTYSNLSEKITVSPNFGSYSYIAWGSWNGGNSTTYTAESDGKTFNPVGGHWLYGQAIGANDIPKTGSATYAGSVMGGYVNHSNGTVETNSVRGSINMNVVFTNGNNSLSGTMNLKRNGASWVNTSFSTGAARPSASLNTFRGELTVENGGKGNVRGSFFGPGATEVGGSYNVDKQSGDFGGSSGVFRAKKQ